MLPLDLLRIPLAWAVVSGVEMTRVGTPIIRVISCDPKGFQQSLQFQKHRILTPTKDIGQDRACAVIDGMPEPAGVAFVPDKRPHLIHLCLRFASALYVPGYLVWVQRAQQSGVGTDMQRSRRIADPTGIETHVDDRVLDLRQTPAVAIVEQKTALGTEGVLAQVALCSPGRFPTFDDLVTLTVRAADGDERHGPFLPMGGYEDEVQCDINLSPSPLLTLLSGKWR